MQMRFSGRKRRTLAWLAVLTAILVAIQRIAVTLDSGATNGFPFEGVVRHEWVTNVLVLWSLGLLLGACYLLRKAQGEQEEWAAIFGSLGPDVLVVVRPDGVIQMCSPAVQAIYGYTPGDVIGQTTELLYRPDPAPEGSLDMATAIARFGFHMGLGTGVRRGGERFPVETVTSHLHGRRDMVVLVRDISERERARAEIVKARDEAEAANAAKGRAMAELEASYRKLVELESWRDNLSHLIVHDIKHVVGGIDGSLQLMERELGPGISTEAKRFLACAYDFTEDLVGMSSSLLDIARLEAAKMPIRKAPCDLEEVVLEAVKKAGGLAGLKELRIEPQVRSGSMTCDRDLITRVIMNLVANAIQVAPERSTVTVDGCVVDGMAVIGVSDRGPGVPAPMQARVFEKFTQGATGGGMGVAGLGLTFCRLAVEAHGGRMGVQSPISSGSGMLPGSRFWFQIPIG